MGIDTGWLLVAAKNTQQLLDAAEEGLMDADVLADTMDSLDGEYEDKYEGYARVMAQLKADAAASRLEAARLSERAHVLEHNRKAMIKRLAESMDSRGLKHVKTNLFSLTLRNTPPRLVIDDKDQLPEDSRIYTWIPNNDLIKTAITSGSQIPGAHLEQGQTVMIK